MTRGEDHASRVLLFADMPSYWWWGNITGITRKLAAAAVTCKAAHTAAGRKVHCYYRANRSAPQLQAPACCEYVSVWCCKLFVNTARLAAESSSVAVLGWWLHVPPPPAAASGGCLCCHLTRNKTAETIVCGVHQAVVIAVGLCLVHCVHVA